MAPDWPKVLMVLTLILKSATYATEDLLDEYVKHVESVNTIGYTETKSNQRFYHSKHRRMTRHLHEEKSAESNNDMENADGIFGDLLDSFPSHLNYDKNTERHSKGKHLSRKLSFFDYLSEDQAVENKTRRDVLSDISWTHFEVLDREGMVVLRWQPRHQEILFRVEVRTTGYLGLGFSPDGKMEKADIILGWVDDKSGAAMLMRYVIGTPHFDMEVPVNLYAMYPDKWVGSGGTHAWPVGSPDLNRVD